MKNNKIMCTKIQIPLKSMGMSLVSSGDFGFSCHWWVKDAVILWNSHNLITILLEILDCLVNVLSSEIQLQNILKHGTVHFLETTPVI